MTAKSRRHKLDKRRKSDEHPQPRHVEEAGGRPEGTRSRTGLIPRKREGQPAADEGNKYLEAIVEAFNSGKAQLRGISLVPEGQGFPGSFVKVEIGDGNGGIDQEALNRAIDFIIPEDLPSLHEVDPKDWGIVGLPEHFRFYVNDQEKEVIDEGYRKYQERQAGGQKGVRTAGSSDPATDG